METFENLLILLGRIGISSLYLWAAIAKIRDWNGTKAYMASRKMPMIFLTLPAAVAIQILGSLSILFGYETTIGAWMLFFFTIPAAIRFHDFWNIKGSMRAVEKTLFMKDMAILGGLLLLTVVGPGSFSFDLR